MLSEFAGSANFFVGPALGLSYKHFPEIYQLLKKKNGPFPVSRISTETGSDLAGLLEGTSSVSCYEPLFGYRDEAIHSQLAAGATARITGKYFNLTHPGCLIYPEYFGCKAWDRIPSSAKADFDKFVAGRTTTWGVPAWQTWLIRLNVVVLVLIGVMTCVPMSRRRESTC